MYWDLVVFIVLIVVVLMFFRNFSSFVYFVAIFDILLRILTFLKNNLGLPDVAALIDKYIPESVLAMIGKYTSGIANTILQWIFVLIMIIFEAYLIKYFVKKRKF